MAPQLWRASAAALGYLSRDSRSANRLRSAHSAGAGQIRLTHVAGNYTRIHDRQAIDQYELSDASGLPRAPINGVTAVPLAAPIGNPWLPGKLDNPAPIQITQIVWLSFSPSRPVSLPFTVPAGQLSPLTHIDTVRMPARPQPRMLVDVPRPSSRSSPSRSSSAVRTPPGCAATHRARRQAGSGEHRTYNTEHSCTATGRVRSVLCSQPRLRCVSQCELSAALAAGISS